MEVSDDILNFIKQEINRLKYGKIIIEIIESSSKIDIIIENRQRFYKPDNKIEEKSEENLLKI